MRAISDVIILGIWFFKQGEQIFGINLILYCDLVEGFNEAGWCFLILFVNGIIGDLFNGSHHIFSDFLAIAYRFEDIDVLLIC